MSTEQSHVQAGEGRPHRAGAFDVRTFIGALIGLYGLILVVMGLVATSGEDLAKAGDVNVNLLAGIGMVVFAAIFLLWARLRPVVVPEETGSPSGDSDHADHSERTRHDESH